MLTLAARIARLFYSLDDYWDDDQFDVDDPHASCSRTMRIGRNWRYDRSSPLLAGTVRQS